MDSRTLRSKKSKPRSARPYDHQNQGLFGKVCSTVKGLLNPSWIISNVSQWMGNVEETEYPEEPEDSVREDNDVVAVSHGSKRMRLRFEEHVPSIQNSETQTWTNPAHNTQPNPEPFTSLASNQSPQFRTAEQESVRNAANCKPLWSSKPSSSSRGFDPTPSSSNALPCDFNPSPSSYRPRDFNPNSPNIRQSPSDYNVNPTGLGPSTSNFKPALSNFNQSPSNYGPSYSFSQSGSNYSPMSASFSHPGGNYSTSQGSFCPAARGSVESPRDTPSSFKFQRRLPMISSKNQPNFNLSSFVGPSKLSQSTEPKVASPFYDGKTTFGGASAVRRMPPSAAPYQVDKGLRSQIKVKENRSEDPLEGMSSAAKRILLTLEKMSTPVSDAKKIPTTSTSPVDLSLYLAPPKSRRNSPLTPSISKGPPIADIKSISRLANLRNLTYNRIRNPVAAASPSPLRPAQALSELVQPSVSESIPQKSGGGKMKNKLNQHHQSAKDTESDMPEQLPLPNAPAPLPISNLPKISFGSQQEVSRPAPGGGFTFSSPIQHEFSSSNIVSSPVATPSQVQSKIGDSKVKMIQDFVFSSPIEINLPEQTLPKEPVSLPASSPKTMASNVPASSTVSMSSGSWECSMCLIRNPSDKKACMACETPRAKEKSSVSEPKPSSQSTKPLISGSCLSVLFPQGTPAASKSASLSENQSLSSVSSGSTLKTWECSSCWVRNKETASVCISCGVSNVAKSTPVEKAGSHQNSSSAVTQATTFSFGSGKASDVFASVAASGFGMSDKSASCAQPNAGFQFSASQAIESDSSKGKGFVFSGPSQLDVPEKTSNKVSVSLPSSSASTAASSVLSGPMVTTSSGKWECSMCWVRNSSDRNACESCETPRPKEKSSVPNSLPSKSINKSSEWVCSSCLVRNKPDAKKCIACETLHPDVEKSSALNDSSFVKFNSLPKSPIAFKFGNFVSTAASSATTPTIQFGAASTAAPDSGTTTVTSGFQFGSSSLITTNGEISETGKPTVSSSGFSFGTSVTTSSGQSANLNKLPSVVSALPLNSAGGASKPSPFPIINKFTESLADSKTASPFGGGATSKSEPLQSSQTVTFAKTGDKLIDSGAKFQLDSAIGKPSEDVSSSIVSPTSMPVTSTTQAPVFNFTSAVSKPEASTGADLKVTADPSSKIQSADGKAVDSSTVTPAISGNFNFGTSLTKESSNAVAPLFKFGSTATTSSNSAAPTSIFSFGSAVSKPAASTGVDLKVSPDPSSKIESAEQGKTTMPASSVNFNFGTSATKESSSTTSVFKFGAPATTASVSSSMFKFGEAKTEAPTSTSAFGFGSGDQQTGSAVFKFGASDSSKAVVPASSAGAVAVKSPAAFSFGAPAVSTSAPSVFGSVASIGATKTEPVTSSAPTSTAATSAPFSFFTSSATPAGSAGFTFTPKQEPSDAAKGGFNFKEPQKVGGFNFTSPAAAVTPASTQSSQGLGLASPASGGFVFGAAKAGNTPAAMPFGSTSTGPTPASASSPFQTFQPAANPTFQFGQQPANTVASAFGSTASFTFGKTDTNQSSGSAALNQAPAFGSTTGGFTFGAKSEASSQPAAPAFGSPASSFSFGAKTAPVSTTNVTPAFGSGQASNAFGGAATAGGFGAPAEKPASSGFTFGAAQPGVFQFGANNPEKKPASSSQSFNFGTPSATENSIVPGGFSLSTPPSFNFGATSTPTQPFHFAASSADTASSSSQRKIKRAVRRQR